MKMPGKSDASTTTDAPALSASVTQANILSASPLLPKLRGGLSSVTKATPVAGQDR